LTEPSQLHASSSDELQCQFLDERVERHSAAKCMNAGGMITRSV
jgi:hypothetical protein